MRPAGDVLGDAAPSSPATAPLLRVRGLTVRIPAPDRVLEPVTDLSFDLAPGEILGLVGESGSGKSLSSLALTGLGPEHARVTGSVEFQGRDLLTLSRQQLQQVRGSDIGYVFQDPQAALNPLMTCGRQIVETIRRHRGGSKAAAHRRAVDLLDAVGIRSAAEVAGKYPHQLSGGMRQRVMIAIALSCDPSVIVADEPTTALDVIVEAQVVRLLEEVRDRTGAAILFISHDLDLVAGLADRVLVMYGGRAMEAGPGRDLLRDPRHPYTRGLIGSVPALFGPRLARFGGIDGVPPNPAQLPPGCPFAPRCDHATDACATMPVRDEVTPEHSVACWHHAELPARPAVAGDSAAAVEPVDKPATRPTAGAEPAGAEPADPPAARAAAAVEPVDAPAAKPAAGAEPTNRPATRPAAGAEPAGAGPADPPTPRPAAGAEPADARAAGARPGPAPSVPQLEVSGLRVRFGGSRWRRDPGTVVVDGVGFRLARGEVLGIVGESGSGKTTLARAITGIVPPAEGVIRLDGVQIHPAARGRYRPPRSVQMVFQDPYASLNPRMRVRDLVAESFDIRERGLSGGVRDERVVELLDRVGIDPRFRDRYPHQFSGGQRQRIAIARALAAQPALLVCDEAVSSLDVSIRAQVLNVLLAERERTGLSLLFIAHDLSVVRHLADTVIVMHQGSIVEAGPADDVIFAPREPYTRDLVAASAPTA